MATSEKSFIPASVHGALDYIIGPVLIASPWLFGFSGEKCAASLFVPLAFGTWVTLLALFTNVETGLFRSVPLQLNLLIETVLGSFLLITPFLYDFYDRVFLPQVILGLILIARGFFTIGSPLASGGKMRFSEGNL